MKKMICVLFVIFLISISTSTNGLYLYYDDILDQEQAIYDLFSFVLNNNNTLAQSFIPTLNDITRVELRMDRDGSENQNITVSIRKTRNGHDLTSVTISSNVIAHGHGDWIEFDFENISINSGETYYIIMNKNIVAESPYLNHICWNLGDDDRYPNGTAWTCSKLDGTWKSHDSKGWDFCFRTYGHPCGPTTPDINGPTTGNIGRQYEYKIVSIDPQGNDITYCIDWGDGNGEFCIGPFPSGEEQIIKNSWTKKGTYTISVKAINIIGYESDYSILKVSMPKNKQIIHSLYNRILRSNLERFPILSNFFLTFI